MGDDGDFLNHVRAADLDGEGVHAGWLGARGVRRGRRAVEDREAGR
ncbi:MAG: hypothetical protein ACI9K2_006134, partial [Myxococcota bacterium]